MIFESLITLFTILTCLIVLISSRREPELVLGSGLLFLVVLQIIPIESALAGLANPGVVTIAALYVVATGIQNTGAADGLLPALSAKPKSHSTALAKLLLPISSLSAVMNNTPVVATFVPAVMAWCRRFNLSPAKFMLPLSYAAILGGMCTLLGSSTNMVVFGLAEANHPEVKLHFASLAWVGVPCLLLGLVYLSCLAWRMLPARESIQSMLFRPKEYIVEMVVQDNTPLIGKSIEQAGLRHLSGVYLVEVIRLNDKGESKVHAPVNADFLLEAGDHLVFSGQTDSIADLLATKGLAPTNEEVFKIEGGHDNAVLVEAVIAQGNPLLGKTIRHSRFRNVYNAAVLAVVRDGQRLKQKVGDIQLRTADTLLLLAHPSFVEQYRHSNAFLLINDAGVVRLTGQQKRLFAWSIVAIMVALAALQIVPIVVAALLAALSMVFTGCCSAREARRGVNFQVILTIAIAFGLGQAMQLSGAAQLIAQQLISSIGQGPFALLVATFVMTVLLTELITNNAAAVLSYSIVSGIVASAGYNIEPYLVCIMVAASASFITPIGYQTNLMVYAAGNYRFKDYLVVGLPLTLLVALVSLTLIPMLWPLTGVL